MGFFAPFKQQSAPHGGGQENPWTQALKSPEGRAVSQSFAPQQGFQPIMSQIQALMQNNAGAPAAMNPMMQPQEPQQPDAMGQQVQKPPSIQSDPWQKMPGQFPFGVPAEKGLSR